MGKSFNIVDIFIIIKDAVIKMRYIDPSRVVHQHLQNRLPPKWRIAIMCFHSKGKTEIIAEAFHGRLLGYRVFSKCDESVVYETDIAGETIGILGWCTGGGPMAASLIEEVRAIGVKYIIGIGAAASISHSVKIQDLILASELLVTDGTSRCYVGERSLVNIHPEMLQLFRGVIKELCLNVKEVRAATVDAMYRQTEQLLQPWRDRGCEVVNWELTPFYVACEICGIKSLWYGHVSDKEIEGKWDDWYCDRMKAFTDSVWICEKLILRLVEEKIHEN